MRYSCKSAVEYDLDLQYKLRDRYIKNLSESQSFDGAYMKRCAVRKGKSFYAVKFPGQARYVYVGDDTHPEIRGIRMHHLYKKAIEVIETNIGVMEDFLRIYRKTNAADFNELLSSTYMLPGNDPFLRIEPEVYKWKTEQLALKEKLPVFDPAGLKVTAFDGTPMRSRAECIHHEAFFIYNVPSIFELPYKANGELLHPDFTALDVFTMTPKIFEHLGNWFHSNLAKRSRYRTDAVTRWDQLAEIGFFPESNLLLTFGADENNFDAQAIHRKIAMLAAPPPSEETMNMLRRQ